MFLLIDWRVFLLSLLLWHSAAHAEYCLNYSSGVMSLGRQAGSSSSRGCVATESQCKAALMSNASSYSGGCYYAPGLYPPTGAAKAGKNHQSNDQAASAAKNHKEKQEAQQRATEQARQQMDADQEKQKLLGDLKGVSPSEPENRITLKPIPPTEGLARSQLDCISHNQPGESWEKRAADCSPVTPSVPEPSSPVVVKNPHTQ